MKDVFVSYRRSDSPDVTGRIFDRLSERFGSNRLFKDVDSIPLGKDFRVAISNEVAQCRTMVVVVGKDWLTVTDENGKYRIQDSTDYVHIEIATALERNIPVVPVLVMGAAMPKASELPEDIREFAYRNGTRVRPDPDFDHDMHRLILHLEKYISGDEKKTASEHVDFEQRQAELHESHPLLGVDSILERLKEDDWSDWSPARFGFLQLRSVEYPKSKEELQVKTFQSGYIFQVLLCAQVEESYVLEIAFSRKYKKTILQGLKNKHRSSAFWESANSTIVTLDSLKDIPCIRCNGRDTISNNESEVAVCQDCEGEGMSTCKVQCKRVYPQKIELLTFIDRGSGADLKSRKFAVLFESRLQRDLQADFPVVIKGLSDPQLDCIRATYVHVRDNLDRRKQDGCIRNPESIIGGDLQAHVKHLEILDSTIRFPGYKILLRGAPAYHLHYSREGKCTKGLLWNKKSYTAQIEGQLWAYGYQPVEILMNKEQIVSEIETDTTQT